MSTTPVTPAPPAAPTPAPSTPPPSHISGGQIATNIINDILLAGTLAASIFVKNASHQQEAGNLISALAKVLQVIEGQIPNTTGQ